MLTKICFDEIHTKIVLQTMKHRLFGVDLQSITSLWRLLI